jgi:peptide/nickel transport system substrate-binding protein
VRRKRAVRAALVWVSVGLVGVLFTSVAAASSVAKASGTGAKVTKVRSSSSPFVVAETVGVEKLDPDVTTGYPDFQALGLIYDQLVQYNSKLQIVPDLATSWKLSNGARAITFQLRRGVKFDDGSAFTSADVVASLHRVLAPKTGDAASSFLSSVKTIVAKGPHAVELVLRRPDYSILDGLTSLNLSILSTKAISAGTVGSKPDGTGPYVFSSWTPDNFMLLKRNTHWWGGKVTIASIRIEAIPTEQSIASAMQANTVQLGLLTEPTVASSLSNFTVEKVLDLSYRTLMLQDRKGPLSRVDNRRAIECAINRQQIIQDAVFGQGKPIGPEPLGPYAPKPIASLCVTPNLAKAKNYLKLAGNPSGFTFTAITSTQIDPTDSAQAIAAQSELASVGITMNIENLSSSTYIADWLKAKFQAAFAWNSAYPEPYTMYVRYFGPGANLGGPAGFSSPKLQQLLIQADETPSAAVRAKDFAAFQVYLTGRAVWVWLFTSYDYAALGHNVHGVQYLPAYTDALRTLAKASY